MRKAGMVLVNAYLAIGGLLAVIMAGSYFVGAFMTAGLMGVFHLPVSWMVFAIPLRAVLWLPSLLVWIATDGGVPFLEWLAPGLIPHHHVGVNG